MKTYSLELGLPPSLPRVMADRRRILQVLGNLLGNVSGYSSDSSTVRITALPGDLSVAVTVDNESADAAAPRQPRQLGRLSRTAEEVAGRRKFAAGSVQTGRETMHESNSIDADRAEAPQESPAGTRGTAGLVPCPAETDV